MPGLQLKKEWDLIISLRRDLWIPSDISILKVVFIHGGVIWQKPGNETLDGVLIIFVFRLY
mgnify:CR=1 FL=1